MASGTDWVRRIVMDELLKNRGFLQRTAPNSGQQDSIIETDPTNNKCTTPDGESWNLLSPGNPKPIDVGIKIGSDTFYCPPQKCQPIFHDAGGTAWVIYSLGGSYYLKNINIVTPALLDTMTILGVASSNVITARFFPAGKRLLVGTGEPQTNGDFLVKWFICNNFGIDAMGHLTGTITTGSKTVAFSDLGENPTDYAVATPPLPGTSGSGVLNASGAFGFTGGAIYTGTFKQTFGDDTNAALLTYIGGTDPGLKHTITGLELVPSVDAMNNPFVDLVGSWEAHRDKRRPFTMTQVDNHFITNGLFTPHVDGTGTLSSMSNFTTGSAYADDVIISGSRSWTINYSFSDPPISISGTQTTSSTSWLIAGGAGGASYIFSMKPNGAEESPVTYETFGGTNFLNIDYIPHNKFQRKGLFSITDLAGAQTFNKLQTQEFSRTTTVTNTTGTDLFGFGGVYDICQMTANVTSTPTNPHVISYVPTSGGFYGFKSKAGTSVAVANDTIPETFEMSPYTTQGSTLTSTPAVITDTHTFYSPTGFGGADKVRAVDSEKFVSVKVSGTDIIIKNWKFDGTIKLQGTAKGKITAGGTAVDWMIP